MAKRRNRTKWSSPAEKQALTALSQRSLNDYVAMARNTSYWRSYGGDGSSVIEPVTIASAMRAAAVWACVRAVTNQICALPVDLTRDGRGKVEEEVQIFKRPSPRVSRRGWIGQVVRSSLTAGNTYGEVIQVDKKGKPTIVEIIDPDLVTWSHLEEPMVLGVKRELWPYGDFWHVPVSHLMVPGSIVALGPIQHASRSIALGMKAEKFGADFFDAGGAPVNILKSSVKGLKEKEAEEAKLKLDLATKNRKTAVFGAEWDLMPMTFDHGGGQMIEAQRFAVEQACRWFGVPPSMVYASVSGASLTYANITQSDLYFLKYSINGWIQDIEDAWSEFLPEGMRVKFNTDAILRMDKKARTEEHGLRLAQKTRTINEVRILEDEEPFDDPIYDKPGIPPDAAPPGAELAPPGAPTQPAPPALPGAKLSDSESKKKPPEQSVIGKRSDDEMAPGDGELSAGEESDPFSSTSSTSRARTELSDHDPKTGKWATKSKGFSDDRCWAGMESVSPEDRIMMNEKILSRTGLTRAEFDEKASANLDSYYERGKDNKPAREWYGDMHVLAGDMADKYEARRIANGVTDIPPITRQVVADMVARTSPQTSVDVNVRIVDSILDEATSKNRVEFSAERLKKYDEWAASKDWPLPDGFKPGVHDVKEVPSLLLVGGENEGYTLTARSRTTSNSAKALDRMRGISGREEILQEENPKISSFATNIDEPARPNVGTMDSHHYFAFFHGIPIARVDGGPRKTLEQWQDEDGIDPQNVVQNFAVKNVASTKSARTKGIGFYPLAVDHMQLLVQRRAKVGDIVNVNSAQSVVWHVSRHDRGNNDVPLAVTRKKIGL